MLLKKAELEQNILEVEEEKRELQEKVRAFEASGLTAASVDGSSGATSPMETLIRSMLQQQEASREQPKEQQEASSLQQKEQQEATRLQQETPKAMVEQQKEQQEAILKATLE